MAEVTITTVRAAIDAACRKAAAAELAGRKLVAVTVTAAGRVRVETTPVAEWRGWMASPQKSAVAVHTFGQEGGNDYGDYIDDDDIEEAVTWMTGRWMADGLPPRTPGLKSV